MRSPNVKSNRFDDWFYAFWKDDTANWHFRKYPCTTDPGTFWLKNPKQPQGTAFLKEGQYMNAWKLGLHQGKYQALVQTSPLTIVRGIQRAEGIDWNGGHIETGNFGINIHRATKSGAALIVDRFSAGCQVLANANDFAELMELAKVHASRYGNAFTYSLLDFRTVRKNQNLKVGLIVLVIGSILAMLGIDWFGKSGAKRIKRSSISL